MKSGEGSSRTAIVATALCGPATASAAVSATVTGDDGNPAALGPGVPLPIRKQDVKAIGHVDPADAKSVQLEGRRPDGVAATTDSGARTRATRSRTPRFVDYRGNGIYTFTVSLFTDQGQDGAEGTSATPGA